MVRGFFVGGMPLTNHETIGAVQFHNPHTKVQTNI